MRETPQREIVVPTDMHAPRPRKAASARKAPRPALKAIRGSDVLALLKAIGGQAARRCFDEPGKAVGAAMALGAAIYVSVNALGMQDGRHPAPILQQPKPAAVEAASTSGSATPAKPVLASAEPAVRDVKPAARQVAVVDPIGDTIKKAEETTASVTPKADRDVMRAQRALSKLGYGQIKDDGVMGPSTKAAIERFERDRKLPVKGEAAGKTLKELTARAGQAG